MPLNFMKKEVFISLFFLIIFLNISIISALFNISCSDNRKSLSDLNEIEIGKARTINELGIGVTKSSESSFFKRITAELLIDAKRSIVSNETSSETLELLTGNYTISFVKANSTTATINVNGESKGISLKQTDSIKGVYIMIGDIDFIETGPKISLIIGSQQIALSNDQNPSQKVSFDNKSFIIEISSASETGALIKVSKCINSDINLIQEAEGQSSQKPKSKTEEERVREENERLNASTEQISVAEFNERKRNQSFQANQTTEQTIKQKGFFLRIWNWIKNLFKVKENEVKLNNTNETNLTNESLVS